MELVEILIKKNNNNKNNLNNFNNLNLYYVGVLY